jgi:hypothetical protein
MKTSLNRLNHLQNLYYSWGKFANYFAMAMFLNNLDSEIELCKRGMNENTHTAPATGVRAAR